MGIIIFFLLGSWSSHSGDWLRLLCGVARTMFDGGERGSVACPVGHGHGQGEAFGRLWCKGFGKDRTW